MNKKHIDILFIFIGLVGMVLIAWTSIEESQAPDIVAAVPVQLLFVGLFIAGYISYSKTDI